MQTETALTIGSVAHMAGVTVRTLHHYDEIGLVVPQERTEAGYRLYGGAEVQRLQEVLFFRELGFGLDEIKRIVNQPTYEREVALGRQRDLLEKRAERLFLMIEAIDRAAAAERKGLTMTNEEMLEVFDGFDPTEYEDEAKERWGDTDAYQESARRTARYTKDDWTQIKAEASAIDAAFLELMRAETSPSSETAGAVVDRHRAHITKWFYECSEQIHQGLGQMYVADSRFTANIDKAGSGLAQYMSHAIAARYSG